MCLDINNDVKMEQNKSDNPSRSRAGWKRVKKHEKLLSKLNPVFDKFDSDQDGLICSEDIHRLLTQVHEQVSLSDIQKVVMKFDKDFDKQLNCTDFIKLISESSKEVTTKKRFLNEIFDGFDKDKNGVISKEEFQSVMRILGEEVNDEELSALFTMFDISEDGNIDFHEFSSILIKEDDFENVFLFKQD